MSSMRTVEMLREEARTHLEIEPADETLDGPISVERLRNPKPTYGLALSGGGIRSATFSLGVLQALAACRLLTSFTYLSTVSGGGYIGSWLTAWAHRHPSGITGVMEDLVPRVDADRHEAAPISHLRRYSNYLTPRVGLLSSDTWTIVGTYLRNLLVNWLSLVPYYALLLLVPVFGVHTLEAAARSGWIQSPVWLGLSGGLILAILSILSLTVTMIVLGVSLPSSTIPGSDSTRVAFVARDQNEFLFKAMVPLVLGGMGLATAWFAQPTPGADGNRELPELFPWTGLSNWQIFTIMGAAAHTAAFSIYAGRDRLYKLDDSRRRVRLTGTSMFVQPVAVLVSGGFGGWIVWLGTSTILPALMISGTAGAKIPLLTTRIYVVTAVPVFLCGFVIGLALYVAMASRRTSEEDREWFARAGAWILALALGWIGISSIALLAPPFLGVAWRSASEWVLSVGGLTGALSLWLGGSGKTKAKDDNAAPQTWLTFVVEWGLAIAAPLFVVLLASLLALGLLALEEYLVSTWSISRLTAAAAIALACTAIIALVSWTVNVNVFSLHGMYRDRLIRTFLGASRATRKEHKFTGFDPSDNLHLLHLSAPFLCAGDWPIVRAVAEQLLALNIDDPARALVDEADSQLLTQAAAVETWSEADIMPLIDRFNAVLLYSKRPVALRKEWETLGRSAPASANGFAAHEWFTVREIARRLDRWKSPEESRNATKAERLITILGDANETEWPRDVMKAPIWSKAETARLLERLNTVIGRYEPAAAVAGAAVGTKVKEEMLANLRSQGVPMSGVELRSMLGDLARRARLPFPIVNTAINLVGGDDLAWQERRAASFTFTPLHAGSAAVGFRSMLAHDDQKSCYGGTSGVSLGTAIAISGAAANPNMGYNSSPIVTLLLTLFNARLGAWLGNPADDKSFAHAYPRNRLLPMALTEALGLTHGHGAYVHLSDGGHFENLGLYELVRRGCRYILLCDGGCDREYAFEDLGNAVRKIRVDLGIEIDFKGFHVGPSRKAAEGGSAEKDPGNYVAVGTINYGKRASGACEGKLLYIKPAIFEKQEEPVDVWQYGRLNPAYPHEPTTDQWFSESQFESYRALGEYIMRTVAGKVCDPSVPPTIEGLFDGVSQYLKAGAAKPIDMPPVVAAAGVGAH